MILAALYPELPEPSELSVLVIDSNGTPIDGAEVSAVGGRHPREHDMLSSGTTGEDGHITLTDDIYEGYDYMVEASYNELYSEPVSVLTEGETEVQSVSRIYRYQCSTSWFAYQW